MFSVRYITLTKAMKKWRDVADTIARSQAHTVPNLHSIVEYVEMGKASCGTREDGSS